MQLKCGRCVVKKSHTDARDHNETQFGGSHRTNTSSILTEQQQKKENQVKLTFITQQIWKLVNARSSIIIHVCICDVYCVCITFDIESERCAAIQTHAYANREKKKANNSNLESVCVFFLNSLYTKHSTYILIHTHNTCHLIENIFSIINHFMQIHMQCVKHTNGKYTVAHHRLECVEKKKWSNNWLILIVLIEFVADGGRKFFVNFIFIRCWTGRFSV